VARFLGKTPFWTLCWVIFVAICVAKAINFSTFSVTEGLKPRITINSLLSSFGFAFSRFLPLARSHHLRLPNFIGPVSLPSPPFRAVPLGLFPTSSAPVSERASGGRTRGSRALCSESQAGLQTPKMMLRKQPVGAFKAGARRSFKKFIEIVIAKVRIKIMLFMANFTLANYHHCVKL
jgi:hypothetical protein